MISCRSPGTGSCGATSRSAAPASRSRGSTRSGPATSPAGCSGVARDAALPGGGDVAEPGGARERRAQAWPRRSPTKPSRARGAGGDRRELLAALLRKERHDRLLRAARLGADRRRRAAARTLRSGATRAQRAGALRSVGRAGAGRDDRRRASDRRRAAPRARPARRSRGASRPGSAGARRSTALGRLERRAPRSQTPSRRRCATTLAALDAAFVELTGRDATRNPGMAYGARTLCLPRLHARPRRDDRTRRSSPSMAPALADALRGRALVQRRGERDRPAGDRAGAARRRPRPVHARARAAS